MNITGADKGSIQQAAAWAITGASYIFITRMIGTFYTVIFRNLAVAKVNTVLSFIAAASILYFYIVFYEKFAKGKGENLERASFIMMAGSLLAVFLFFKGILMVFDIVNFRSVTLALFIPALSSIISLYFFVTLYRKISPGRPGLLRQAVMLAVFGSILSIFIRALVMYNYFAEKNFEWLWRFTQSSPLIFVPIIAFIFFTGVYFFFVCYKELKTQ